jgi:hypothetical protein
MAIPVTKGGTQIAQNISKWSKPINMTIHWKALNEHFLIIPFLKLRDLKYILVKIGIF